MLVRRTWLAQKRVEIHVGLYEAQGPNTRASIDKNATTLKLSRPNLVTYLYWTPVLECCVVNL